MVAAGFEDVVETDEVALDIGSGIGDAVTDSGLGGEIDDDVGEVFVEEAVDEGFVGDVAFDEDEVFMLVVDLLESLFLDVDVVVIVHVVDADDFDIIDVIEEALDEVRADESGGSGDEDSFIFEGYVVFNHNFGIL